MQTRRSFLAAATGTTLALATGAWVRAELFVPPIRVRLTSSPASTSGCKATRSASSRSTRPWPRSTRWASAASNCFDAHFSSKSTRRADRGHEGQDQGSWASRCAGTASIRSRKDHEANRRWFEFAKKAGIKSISANPSEDSFDSLDKLCEEYQIRIAIHNHGPGAATTRSPTCSTPSRGTTR